MLLRWLVPMDSFRVGTSSQKDQDVIRELELATPTLPQPLVGGERLETEWVIHGQWFNQPFLYKKPLKNLKQQDSESLQVGKRIHVTRGWHTQLHRNERSCVGDPLDLALCASSSGSSVVFVVTVFAQFCELATKLLGPRRRLLAPDL